MVWSFSCFHLIDLNCLIQNHGLIKKANGSTETVLYSEVAHKWREIKLIPSSVEIQQEIKDIEVVFYSDSNESHSATVWQIDVLAS